MGACMSSENMEGGNPQEMKQSKAIDLELKEVRVAHSSELFAQVADIDSCLDGLTGAETTSDYRPSTVAWRWLFW